MRAPAPETRRAPRVDLPERQHRHRHRPQAEHAHAVLLARDRQHVAHRVVEVAPAQRDEPPEPRVERARGLGGTRLGRREQRREVGRLPVEDVARQPADPAPAVVVDVLEDVGQLQPVAERHGQRRELVAARGHGRRVVAEELRQHLPDDTGDVVAIALERGHVREPRAPRRPALETVHAFGHRRRAAGERRPLDGIEAGGHAEHLRHRRHQLALPGRSFRTERGTEVGGQRLRRLVAGERPLEAREEGRPRVVARLGRQLVLDRVDQAAQQVAVADDVRERRGQARDRQRERPRDVPEQSRLQRPLLRVRLAVGILGTHVTGESGRSGGTGYKVAGGGRCIVTLPPRRAFDGVEPVRPPPAARRAP